MQKIFIIVLLCSFLFGCSENEEMNRAVELRNRLCENKGISFCCTITADYVDNIRSFQLECEVESTGDVTFFVVAPESIAGIGGQIDGKNGSFQFDKYALSFPLMADELLSPVSMPWVIAKALRSGYIRSTSLDGDSIRITIDDTFMGQTLQVDAWIKEDLSIDYCEIIWEGRRLLSMKVESFAWL